MKLKKILWQMGNDFQGEYECEFCGTTKTDKTATSYMDSYFMQNVVPNMICPQCGKKTKVVYTLQEGRSEGVLT